MDALRGAMYTPGGRGRGGAWICMPCVGPGHPCGGPAQWGLTRIQMRPRPWEPGGSLIEGLCGQLGHESRFAWSFGPLVTNFHIYPGPTVYPGLRGPSDRWTETSIPYIPWAIRLSSFAWSLGPLDRNLLIYPRPTVGSLECGIWSWEAGFQGMGSRCWPCVCLCVCGAL